MWSDIEVVGILRLTGDGLVLDTEEEHRGLGSDIIVLKRSTWLLTYTAPGDARVVERLRLLNGKKVAAAGKGLFIPETAYFLGVPVQTVRMERELRNPVLTEVK
ncbi:MAG: hypothetical protein U0793_33740 [Gemmataceae bacterium]